MTSLAIVLLILAIVAAIWSLIASHTSDCRAGLLEDSRRGGRDLYSQTCLELGIDPLEGRS